MLKAEQAETSNWLDAFAAAPPHVVDALGLSTTPINQELTMVRSHIPFCHFNMVMHLGYPVTPGEEEFAAIDTFFQGQKHWIIIPVGLTDPPDLEAQLVAHEYEKDDSWDRIILQNFNSDDSRRWADHASGCEMVDDKNAEDWSSFVVQCYSMPPLIQDWLKAYVGRQHWFHAVLRDGNSGDIVMARSLYLHKGFGWLGIDAPVPGLMAPCFEQDQKVTAALLIAAAGAGAHSFVTDIEAPNEKQQGPAYERWDQLGFKVAYRRQLYVKKVDGDCS